MKNLRHLLIPWLLFAVPLFAGRPLHRNQLFALATPLEHRLQPPQTIVECSTRS